MHTFDLSPVTRAQALGAVSSKAGELLSHRFQISPHTCLKRDGKHAGPTKDSATHTPNSRHSGLLMPPTHDQCR